MVYGNRFKDRNFRITPQAFLEKAKPYLKEYATIKQLTELTNSSGDTCGRKLRTLEDLNLVESIEINSGKVGGLTKAYRLKR